MIPFEPVACGIIKSEQQALFLHNVVQEDCFIFVMYTFVHKEMIISFDTIQNFYYKCLYFMF